MKKLLTLFLFITLTAAAQRADYSKLSPWVRQAVSTQLSGSRRTAQHDSKQMMTVFVKTTATDSETLLQHYGGRRWAQSGNIAIATIPVNRIGDLSRHPDVQRIEASMRAQTTMDTVPRIVNTLPAYVPTEQYGAFTGKGVVMGLMDVGFDLTHPDFFDGKELAEYRIKAFWDQLSQDTIGSTLPVGRDFIVPADILEQRSSTDGRTQTHGTHTLGIAAGSGYDSPYRGIAYESDICLVSNAISSDTIYIDEADYYKYTSATDALGFKYLFDYADQQGKPCVASFSEGYTPFLDEEDLLFSEFLDSLTGPGHIIVSAAGNEGITMAFVDKPQGTAEAGAFVYSYLKTAYYRIKTDGQVNVGLYSYGDGNAITGSLHIDSQDDRLDTLLTDTLRAGDYWWAVNAYRYKSFPAEDTMILLSLTGTSGLNVMPHIALTVEGTDSHASIYGASNCLLLNFDTDPRWNNAERGNYVLAPACFESVICVGSTSHRLGFYNYLGEYRDYSADHVKGQHTLYSSTGPAMNGLMKPDVSAPGDNVISAYSSFYLEDATPEEMVNDVVHFIHDGRVYSWSACSGTSMSCPVVAGIIALWLQANPQLTREDVMGVISRTSRHPEENLNYPNNIYGYGEIDGYKGLLDVLSLNRMETISQHQPQAVRVSADDNNLFLTFTTVPTSPVRVSIYSVGGQQLVQHELTPASTVATLPLPKLPAGIYAVQLTSREQQMTGSQLIRIKN